MIGLSFLAAGLLWVAAAWWLCKRLPRSLGIQKHGIWLIAVCFPALLVLPFVDHIVGMRQFEKLCEEQTGITVSPESSSVKRGDSTLSGATRLSGYAININLHKVSHSDLDTKKIFLTYNYFSTSGGRVAGLALMGGKHSCAASNPKNINHSDYLKATAYKRTVNGN